MKAYKNVRLVASVGTETEVFASPESPEKLLPQRKQPAQRTRFNLSTTSKAASAKAWAAKLGSSPPVLSGYFFLYIWKTSECCTFVSFVAV